MNGLRLVNVDELHTPPDQRGLYAILDEHGATLSVGYLEPDADGVGAMPGSTITLRFRVKGGIRE